MTIMAECTKMFHAKHFRPVEAEDLTKPHTCRGLSSSGIRKLAFYGPMVKAMRGSPAAFGRELIRTGANVANVLEAIKDAAAKCGITAERVDEVDSNEPDRILESIARAEFVNVDLRNLAASGC
jgi:hypothetical protein